MSTYAGTHLVVEASSVRSVSVTNSLQKAVVNLDVLHEDGDERYTVYYETRD